MPAFFQDYRNQRGGEYRFHSLRLFGDPLFIEELQDFEEVLFDSGHSTRTLGDHLTAMVFCSDPKVILGERNSYLCRCFPKKFILHGFSFKKATKISLEILVEVWRVRYVAVYV
jgi:hypothetical protein